MILLLSNTNAENKPQKQQQQQQQTTEEEKKQEEKEKFSSKQLLEVSTHVVMGANGDLLCGRVCVGRETVGGGVEVPGPPPDVLQRTDFVSLVSLLHSLSQV